MKTSINRITSKPGHISRIKILTFAAALIVPAATGLAQTMWTDGTADFNNPADWNGTYIDDSSDSSPNPNCDNDTGSNNVILIQTGDPAWYHGDTLAGQGNNTSGAYLQTGSTNNTGYPANGNWLRMGIGSGTYGSYILSNGVVNVAGQTHLGESGTGYLEVDGGVYNTGYNGDPGICAGDGDFGPGTGTLVLTNGTINNNQETWFGEAGGGGADTGYFIMRGGTFNANNWFVFGRNNGGAGYGVMTGGTINFTGSGQFLVGGGGLGSLIQSGGTINVYNQYLVPQSGNLTTDVGTNILSGTAVLNVHDWLAVGRDSGYGELDISGNASITRDNANDSGANFDVGASALGILNQNGGAITNLAGHTYIGESGTGTWNLNSGIASLGAMIMGVNGSASGTFNLNGGTLQTSGIGAGSGGSEINFNGGTLQASANNLNFISGITFAQVSSPGGAVIDSQSYNITIPEQLNDNGNGPLTKLGTGTLTLTGQNTYAGTTTVSAGTLNTTTASTGAGAYSVAGGTTLGVQVASQNTQLVAGGLAAGSSSTLNIDLNTFGNPSSAPIDVAGALTVSGPVTLNVTAEATLAVGQFSLITYSSQSGSANIVLGPLPPGVSGYLSNNVNNSSIDLVITNVAAPRWNGTVNGNWDVNTTANWVDLVSSASETFQNFEPVVFNDSATGTTVINVVAPSVSPGSITVNNTALSYSFTGSGQINGTAGLVKEGANSLSILNSAGNGYTGPTVLDGGTLNVTNLANGGSASAIGASSANAANLLLGGGTLAYSGPAVSIDRGYTAADTNSAIDINTVSNLTLSGTVTALPGAGFAKSGPAQLGYTGSGISTLSDVLGYQVDAGSVMFGGSGTNDIAGNFNIAVSNNVAAAVSIANNATVSLVGGGLFDIADSLGLANTNYGVVNQSGGTVNVSASYSTFIGQNSNSVGVYNLSGGAFNFNNWLAVGRDNGVGTINLSGSGALNMISGNGGNIDIGNSGGISGQLGAGTLNQSGGSVSNVVAGTWLGEGSGAGPSGTWNMTGGIAWLGYLGIGYNGTGTGVFNISGNASVTVYNNATELGRIAGTTGTLTIGSTNGSSTGSLTLNSGSDFNVGNAGAGVLNMLSGGTLSMQGTMYLTRQGTSTGYVYLNSGATIITGYLNNGWGFNQGISNNPEAFYFNGGTLQAYTGSPYFIQPYVNAVIETNGAFINDGGYTISAECVFADATNSTAGLTKSGSGTLYLTAANTYTGPTVVSSGTLAAYTLAGGVTVDSGATLLNANTINGPVAVNSGGTIGGNVGDANTMTINNTLTLSAGSTTVMPIAPASNAQIVGLTGVTYGGSLIVSNVSSSPLIVGDQYKLFNSSSSGTGNFSTVTILPSGSGTFNPATGILTITSSGVLTMNQPYLSNGNLVLTGTGGTASGNYILLSTTNLLLPIIDWTTNTTGVFSATGTFSNSVPIIGANSHEFFMVKP